jgi:hypothetical protein
LATFILGKIMKKNARKFTLLPLIIVLSACGTQGTINQELLSKPIPKNQSRLIVTRDNSLLYLAGAADVALDGRPIASLARGGTVVGDVDPGKHFLTVRAPGTVGDYTASFETRAGKTYRFTVGPNKGKSLLPGALFGQLGETIDNSGYFQVVPASADK